MKTVFSLVLLLSSLLLLVSCGSDRLFEENKAIGKNEWDQHSPLVFIVPISETDTISTYNFYVNVRHSGSYRFSNLYLFVNIIFPGGQLQRDTLECILAAPDGRWLGNGLGDIWDNRILLKEGVRFPEPGEYRFELFQAMRVSPLPGIMDAGIRIEKKAK